MKTSPEICSWHQNVRLRLPLSLSSHSLVLNDQHCSLHWPKWRKAKGRCLHDLENLKTGLNHWLHERFLTLKGVSRAGLWKHCTLKHQNRPTNKLRPLQGLETTRILINLQALNFEMNLVRFYDSMMENLSKMHNEPNSHVISLNDIWCFSL